MLKLLPYRFKRIGAIATPLGFSIWLLMQFGLVTRLGEFLGIEDSFYLNAIVGSISFFSFLFGIYALTFSYEKMEDEMIRKIRLESFQFGALLQLLFIIIGFLAMVLIEEPKDGGLMLFFIMALFIFWLSYIIRFNYIIHVGIYKYEK